MIFVQGDITPRQKMLADVVKRILPGRTRSELKLDGDGRFERYEIKTD